MPVSPSTARRNPKIAAGQVYILRICDAKVSDLAFGILQELDDDEKTTSQTTRMIMRLNEWR